MTRTAIHKAPGLFLLLISVLFGAWACNNLLGIDEGRTHCLRSSDCDKTEVCLYGACSEECRDDIDCNDDEHCAPTDIFGPRCIAKSIECEANEDCEAGAVCQTGRCRFPCEDASACLPGQSCEAGYCEAPEATDEDAATSNEASSASSSAATTNGSGGTLGMAGAPGQGGDSGDAPGSCDDGDFRCVENAHASRQTCKNGTWVEAEPCQAGQLCDSSNNGTCATIVEACEGQEPGAATCNGAVRVVCGPDLVTVETETCESAAHCNQATGPRCAVCLENEFKCDGDVLSECAGNRLGFDVLTECEDEPCNATLGECTTRICNPGESSCTNNTLQLCNDDGTAFAQETPCGEDTCDAEGQECDVCAAGQVLGCDDDTTKRVCDGNGQGTTVIVCADEDADNPVCIGAGLCRSCEPSTAECVDTRRLRTCNGQGQWDAAQTCSGQACYQDACVGVCVPGATDCVDETSFVTCENDGQWGDAEECVGQACSGASCTGQCSPGDTQCVDEFSVRTCNGSGGWDAATTCTGQACVGDDCGGVCVPESTSCADLYNLLTCESDGQWGDPDPCTGQACGGTPARCIGTCSPGDKRCLDNVTAQSCNNSGAWVSENCTGSTPACIVDQCGGDCTPGSRGCNGSTPYTCPDGLEVEGSACNFPSQICRTAACVTSALTLGNPTAFASVSTQAAARFYAFPVELDYPATLLRFGIYGRLNNGTFAKLALYSDNNGYPRTLLDESTSMAVPTEATVERAGLSQPDLGPGTYWIAIKYDATANLYRDVSTLDAPVIKYIDTSDAFADPFPATFPTGAQDITERQYNYYIDLQYTQE